MIAPISAFDVLTKTLERASVRNSPKLVLAAALFATLIELSFRLASTVSGDPGGWSAMAISIILLMIGVQLVVALRPDRSDPQTSPLGWGKRHMAVFAVILSFVIVGALIFDVGGGIVAGIQAEVGHFEAQRLVYAADSVSRSDANMALLTMTFMPLFVVLSSMALLAFLAVPALVVPRLLPAMAAKLRGEEVRLGDHWRYTSGNSGQLAIVLFFMLGAFGAAWIVGSAFSGLVDAVIPSLVPWTAQFIVISVVTLLNLVALTFAFDLISAADSAIMAVRETARAESRLRRGTSIMAGGAVGLV